MDADGGTEALPEITVCENSLPCRLKLYDANKKPYTKMIQKCGHLLFCDFCNGLRQSEKLFCGQTS